MNYLEYWVEPPPCPSERLSYWVGRISRGWRPKWKLDNPPPLRKVTEFFKVYAWEYRNVLLPLLRSPPPDRRSRIPPPVAKDRRENVLPPSRCLCCEKLASRDREGKYCSDDCVKIATTMFEELNREFLLGTMGTLQFGTGGGRRVIRTTRGLS